MYLNGSSIDCHLDFLFFFLVAAYIQNAKQSSVIGGKVMLINIFVLFYLFDAKEIV